MTTLQDPRDAAILALRNALIESRQNMTPNAKQIDAVLSETEQVARDAASRILPNADNKEYDLLDLEGAGADMWRDELRGMDAQDYVSHMRDEWDEREQEWRK